MGWFDTPASFDWNGDGTIDNWDMGIELCMMNSISDDLARHDRIDRMAQAIRRSGIENVDNATFDWLCRKNGLQMSDFEQCDIDELRRKLK